MYLFIMNYFSQVIERLYFSFIKDHPGWQHFRVNQIHILCQWSTDPFILSQFRRTEINRSQSPDMRQDVRFKLPKRKANLSNCNFLHYNYLRNVTDTIVPGTRCP